ncbi:hypothetical protein BSL78_28205 [Apostichopus japonicus]|uniref:Uncharacterized protein n=1 Tax=Stichopus japonicus TaxID=307972 RepID=A0A2G8JGU6_STIJA|nr:hypothetical protein BSL78_28205 [Apostichopus japonicus]
MKERVDKRQVERMHAEEKQGDEVKDSVIQKKRAIDGEDGLDQAEDTKKEDMEDKDGASHRPKNSPASRHPPEENNNSNDQKGGASVPLSSEMEIHDDSEGKEDESRAEDLTAKESGHHVREMLPSSADHNREMLPSSADHNTDDDQNQQLPTASIGSDLIQEAEVSERSFPKSKKRSSMPSTPQAQAKQDDTEIGSIAEDSLTSDEWPEGGLETDGEALPQDDEPGTVNAPSKDGDALSKLGEELDGKEDVVDGTRGTGASRLQDEFADGDAPSVGTASTADDALMGKQTEGRNASSEKSDELSRSRQSSSSRTSLLMDQLEEEAAAIAEAVLQRPRSGRDLAEDAQLAAALWRERLGQLLQARPPPDDTRSVIVRRRKNSMDGSSVASSDIGQWDGADLLTGVERKSRRQRRVLSAQAAVDLFDPSLDSEDLSSTVDSEGGKPSSRQDPLKLDVTHFGVADKPKEQRRASESKEDSELERIVADIDLLSKTPGTASTKKSKGSKSSKSQKSDKSSKKSGKSQKSEKSDKDEDKAKEFIVTMPHDDKEDYLAYSGGRTRDEAQTRNRLIIGQPEYLPWLESWTFTICLSYLSISSQRKVQLTLQFVNPVVPKPPKKPKKEKAKKDKPKKSKKKKVEPATEEKKPKDTPSTEEPEKKGEDNVIKAEDSEKVNKDAPEVGGEAENVEEDEEDLVSVKAESPEFIIIHEVGSSVILEVGLGEKLGRGGGVC